MFEIIFLLFSLIYSLQLKATVYPMGKDFDLVFGEYNCDEGISCGTFFNQGDGINKDGWDKLSIKTNTHEGKYSIEQTYKAAGYLEGALSWRETWAIWYNHLNHWGWVNSTVPSDVYNFMEMNWEYTKQTARKNKENDEYWSQVANLVAQFEGMLEGYNKYATKEKTLKEMNLFFLQSAGDLYGVLSKFKMELPFQGLDCSGMIKIVPSEKNPNGFSNVFVGHDTFRSYGIQNKVFKTFNFDDTYKVAFSSSPGFISSKDDYYLTSNGLVVIETTNSVFDATLAKQITPYSLFTWIRSPLCSRLAKSGKEWTNYFSMHSSATYTNQWMVIDMKKFSPDEPLEEGFFYIAEEIPNLTQTADMTKFISSSTYWPSYNIPFFPEIYNRSGYPEKKKEQGDKYDYDKCPRAKIFKDLEGQISTFEDFGYVMQYNEWKTNPYSLGDPCNSIMSRCDLREENAAAFGGIDGKITNFDYSKDMKTKIIAGPTNQNREQTPPFVWIDEFKDTIHEGQPSKYDFSWLDISME